MIEQCPLSEFGTLPCQPTWLLHFAFLGKERAEAMPEAEYRAANGAIRQTVINALDPIGVEAAFIASSGAAARAEDTTASPAMRLYGALKRDDEHAFANWAEASCTNATIARIFNMSGPHINKPDHDVRRGYVAISERMSLIFAQLLEGRGGVTRFDSGGDEIELGALAQMIATSLGCVVECPALCTGIADIYLGDDGSYRRQLARHRIASVPLAEQIAETAMFQKAGSAVFELQDAYA